jgi:hypothetical protein
MRASLAIWQMTPEGALLPKSFKVKRSFLDFYRMTWASVLSNQRS